MVRMGATLAYSLFILLVAVSGWAETMDRYQPLVVPPPVAVPAYVPFPALPTAALDEAHNGIGVAQQMARARGAQGRILWIDGLANIGRINSAAKIQALTAQIKSVGFNTVVLDAKPIPGFTLYPSAYAPKMTEWKNATLPADFDPLAELINDGHAVGLSVIASMNVFSEGHRRFGLGPGYAHPEWQSTMLEPEPVIVGANAVMPLAHASGGVALPASAITTAPSMNDLPLTATTTVVIVDASRKVVAATQGTEIAQALPVPTGGAVLAAEGAAGDFLRTVAMLGTVLTIDASPNYVLAGQSSDTDVPLWTNPNNPVVQQRILDMVTELVTKYPVDGVIFDDRLRYSNVNADFSDESRKAFEAYVGKPLNWPSDVLRLQVTFPPLKRRLLPGPYFDDWRLWHALTIRNWLARAAATVKSIRPTATVSVYVGSWYGDYFDLGSNWAANDFQAGYRALTDAYRQTGFAGLVDWMTTGCYDVIPTVGEANAQGESPEFSIEGAGQLSNRCAHDHTWVYAGILLEKFNGNPDGLARALQAAAASTQGIMVFDLSHHIEQFWPVFQQAFCTPALAPHAVPGLIDQVRAASAARTPGSEPPVIIRNGVEGMEFPN